MMKTIRLLILFAIIVLVALAFLSGSPENPEQKDALESIMQPLLEMQQKIEQNYPELRGDITELKNDIRNKILQIDPKNLIPFHLSSSSPSLPADMTVPAEAPGEEAPIQSGDDVQLDNKINNLAESLKKMDADELAQRMKVMYERMRQHVQTEEPTPAGQ